MTLKNKIYLIKQLFEEKIKECTLIQVGSSAKCNEYNDIDFLVVTDNPEIVINAIKKCFAGYINSMIDDSIKIKNYFDVELSFAIYNHSKLFDIVNSYNSSTHIIAEHKSWTIGYWLIEGFISDLKNGIILLDYFDVATLQKELIVNPKQGENRILKSCLEEIQIKQTLLKSTHSIIEKNFLKQDVYLATLRAFSIINKTPLHGFKRIEKNVDKLSKNMKFIINNLFVNDNIDKTIQIIFDELNKPKLYMGTWQFGGDFKKYNEDEIIRLLMFAKKEGINRFDTALVYGNGFVENCISKIRKNDDIVLTKVPAKVKPLVNEPINLGSCYTKDYIEECLKKSLLNLKVEKIDILLLHNWNYAWNESDDIINWLIDLKMRGLVKKVGISLPNNYNRRLSEKVVSKIDVIEAPFNEDNKWIKSDIEYYKKFNLEIILRSIFMQGKLLKKDKNSYLRIIDEAIKLKTSLVIGMTTEKQISENVKYFNGVENE